MVPWPHKTFCLFRESRDFASYAMNYDIIFSLSFCFRNCCKMNSSRKDFKLITGKKS